MKSYLLSGWLESGTLISASVCRTKGEVGCQYIATHSKLSKAIVGHPADNNTRAQLESQQRYQSGKSITVN